MPAEDHAVAMNIAGELTQFVAQMRNVLHLCLSFSPLLILHPKKLDVQAIRRDYLIAVSTI